MTNEQLQNIVAAGGGKFLGIQRMYGSRPDVLLFQAGDKGSSLALPVSEATVDRVRAKILEPHVIKTA